MVYIVRLFFLQMMSDDYKKNADSNAFLKKVEFPSRGIITDRNGRLLVYNQPAYDIMVVMREARGKTDTTALCKALGITREYFIERMEKIKRSPGYSSFTQQLFMNQLSDKDFSLFQEKIYRFPGFTYSAAVSGSISIRMLPTCLVTWLKCRRPISRTMITTSRATI